MRTFCIPGAHSQKQVVVACLSNELFLDLKCLGILVHGFEHLKTEMTRDGCARILQGLETGRIVLGRDEIQVAGTYERCARCQQTEKSRVDHNGWPSTSSLAMKRVVWSSLEQRPIKLSARGQRTSICDHTLCLSLLQNADFGEPGWEVSGSILLVRSVPSW